MFSDANLGGAYSSTPPPHIRCVTLHASRFTLHMLKTVPRHFCLLCARARQRRYFSFSPSFILAPFCVPMSSFPTCSPCFCYCATQENATGGVLELFVLVRQDGSADSPAALAAAAAAGAGAAAAAPLVHLALTCDVETPAPSGAPSPPPSPAPTAEFVTRVRVETALRLEFVNSGEDNRSVEMVARNGAVALEFVRQLG